MKASTRDPGAVHPKPVNNPPRGLAAIAAVQPVLLKSLGIDRSGTQRPEARQVRAARALLDWGEAETAKAAGITVAALSKIERGVAPLHKKTMACLCAAFSTAGVVLLHSGDGPDDGVGVRLRRDRKTEP